MPGWASKYIMQDNRAKLSMLEEESGNIKKLFFKVAETRKTP